eukprot:3279707-Pleurochrysis_carterae.AAC.1
MPFRRVSKRRNNSHRHFEGCRAARYAACRVACHIRRKSERRAVLKACWISVVWTASVHARLKKPCLSSISGQLYVRACSLLHRISCDSPTSHECCWHAGFKRRK